MMRPRNLWVKLVFNLPTKRMSLKLPPKLRQLKSLRAQLERKSLLLKNNYMKVKENEIVLSTNTTMTMKTFRNIRRELATSLILSRNMINRGRLKMTILTSFHKLSSSKTHLKPTWSNWICLVSLCPLLRKVKSQRNSPLLEKRSIEESSLQICWTCSTVWTMSTKWLATAVRKILINPRVFISLSLLRDSLTTMETYSRNNMTILQSSMKIGSRLGHLLLFKNMDSRSRILNLKSCLNRS